MAGGEYGGYGSAVTISSSTAGSAARIASAATMPAGPEPMMTTFMARTSVRAAATVAARARTAVRNGASGSSSRASTDGSAARTASS